LPVHFILCIEERPPFLVALGFEGLDPFLPDELLFQRHSHNGSAAGLLDLTVQLFYLPLEPKLEVIGPAIEFFGFGLEEVGVALGDLSSL
jgi:hypothetical protein